jgi:hypothetical protein
VKAPRRATPGDAAALRDLVLAAYTPWVAIIGRQPGPMTDDYTARIAAGEAWVVDGAGGLLGAIILEDTPDGLLIDKRRRGAGSTRHRPRPHAHGPR